MAGATYRVGYPGQASHRRPRNWSHQGELEHGEFSYLLILDDGAQEVLVMPTADDAKVLRDFFHDADAIYWDTEREVFTFGKIDRG